MRKTISFLAGALSMLIVYLLIASYGNIKVHRGLNLLMVNSANTLFTSTLEEIKKFENYIITWDSRQKFSGSAVTNAGSLSIDEGTREYIFKKWVQEGGFSADEPEIFASFRHFYDPTKDEGNRYLHDHLDYLDSKGLVNQPAIDHIEWALSHSMHEYNWQNGKTAMVSALSTFDEDYSDEQLAFAYRALGETLHMIADMGLPAHVRDDSHPSATTWNLGCPDAYEVYAEGFDVSAMGAGKVDENLKQKFRTSHEVKEIAETLAKYTNENFFTGQTIYGKDKDGELVKPIIHANKPYESPDLNDCEYDFSTIGYYKTISGQEVLMCRDHYYSRFYKGYPYIDRACAESQAKVLIPQIVEAGANVIRLFIPELKLEITGFDEEEETITGKVKHITGVEYDREIKYNGMVAIYNNKNQDLITEVECIDGEFEEEIKLRDFRKVDWEEEGIFAQIDCGNIRIKSEPFKDDIKTLFTRINFRFNINGTIRETKGDNETISETGSGTTYGSFMLEDITEFTQTDSKITITLDSLNWSNRNYNGFINIDFDGKNFGTIEASVTVYSYGYIKETFHIETIDDFTGCTQYDNDHYRHVECGYEEPASVFKIASYNSINTLNETPVIRELINHDKNRDVISFIMFYE